METTQMSKISRNIKISVIIALILAIFSGGLLVRKNRRDEEGRRIYNLSMQVDARGGVPLRLCRTPDCQWSHRFCTVNGNGAVCETFWNRNTSDVYVQRVRNAVCFGRNDGPGSLQYMQENSSVPSTDPTLVAIVERNNTISTFTDMATLFSPPSTQRYPAVRNSLICKNGDLVASIRVPTNSDSRWRNGQIVSLFGMIQD